MSRQAPIRLPPTHADLAISRACARHARPGMERTLQVVTWLADEKIMLGAAALFWMDARLRMRQEQAVRRADRLLCSVVLAGALPHLFKHLVARRRPDRTVVHHRRRGIPRSGNAWHSFPSGHALHLGAVAGSVLRLTPSRFRPFVWPGIIALASSRIMLLAHYPTDVAAGLGLGVLLDKAVGRLMRAARSLCYRGG
jgi:membrane-associated phospholipid phosphatase